MLSRSRWSPVLIALVVIAAACSSGRAAAFGPMPPEAVRVGAEVLVTDELVGIADLQPGDDLFEWPALGDRVVLIRTRPGESPLLFGTSCDVVSATQLPTGWQGVCLEYTSAGERVVGQFPHGTTSEGG
ncbi:MAG: hypothetical protein WD652_04260 [Acidimicrobiia bacterium]